MCGGVVKKTIGGALGILDPVVDVLGGLTGANANTGETASTPTEATTVSDTTLEARDAEKRRRAAAAGLSSTILGGSSSTTGTTATKTLLGQ